MGVGMGWGQPLQVGPSGFLVAMGTVDGGCTPQDGEVL